MGSSDHFEGKEQEEGKRERELLSEVNIRVVSGGENEFIGDFKMVAGDINGIEGVAGEVHVYSTGITLQVTTFLTF